MLVILLFILFSFFFSRDSLTIPQYIVDHDFSAYIEIIFNVFKSIRIKMFKNITNALKDTLNLDLLIKSYIQIQ